MEDKGERNSSHSSNVEEKQHDVEKCPCGHSNRASYKLKCTKTDCGQSWHLDCVGLKGLTKVAIEKLEYWLYNHRGLHINMLTKV